MLNWAMVNRKALSEWHYTMKGTAPNYFFNLVPGVLGEYVRNSGGDFCLVIIGDEGVEDDFWAIPFARVKDLFTEVTLTKDSSQNPGRWLCNITKGQLHVFPGAEGGQRGSALGTDVSDCYGDRGRFGLGHGTAGSRSPQQGDRRMKVKITMDRNAPSSHKSSAAQKVHRDLGSKVSISGDVITVDEGYDERKVIDILNGERINYSRST